MKIYFFQNQEVYKTGFGALISVIIFAVFCLACYYQSSELFQRYNPIVLTSEQFVKNPERMTFDKEQQITIMGLTDNFGRNIYDPQVIQVSSYMTSLKKIDQGSHQISLNKTKLAVRPCNIQDIKSVKLNDLFNNLHLDYFFCFEDGQKVYIEGDYSGDFYSKIDVFFKQCKNSTQPGSVVCKPQEHIDQVTKDLHFLTYIADKIIDPSNLENPFGYQSSYIETQTSALQSQQFTAFFENYYIQSDTGYFSKQINQIQDFLFVQSQSNYVFSDPGLIIQFTLTPHRNKQTLMQRRYMKFSELIAQLGGLFKLLTLIGFVITYPFAKIYLNKEIVNSLFEFNLNSEGQKIEKTNQNNCLFETNFIEAGDKQNQKQVKICEQIQQINQNLQKQTNSVNQNIENISQFDHVLDKSNNKNIQNSLFQNQESAIEQLTTSSPNNKEVNKENFRLLQLTQFSEIESQNVPKKVTTPNQAFRRNGSQKAFKMTKSNFNHQEENKITKQNQQKKENQIQLSYFERIKCILNPLKKKISLSYAEYFQYLTFKCSKLFELKKFFILEGIGKVQNSLDIQNIVKKLQEIDRLKQIILNEDQLKLFEIMPQPILNSQTEQSKTKNQDQHKTNFQQEERTSSAYNSLIKMVNQPFLSKKDFQIINLLDEQIYKALRNSQQDINSLKSQNKNVFINDYVNENKSINLINLGVSNAYTDKFKNQIFDNFLKNEDVPEECLQKLNDSYFHKQKKKNQNQLNLF